MALWAEVTCGAAQNVRNVALLTLGTGVGGGVVVDGQLLGGAGGLAGELGHVPVADTGPECVCGGTGCLELFASGPALLAAARGDLTPQDGTAGPSTPADVVAAATRGDRDARTVLERAGHAVGLAVARFVPVLDPELVLLGGSLAFAGSEVLLPAAREGLRSNLILSDLRTPPRLDLATCGPEAGAVGAAACALAATHHLRTAPQQAAN
jgi:glucokinase